MPHPTGDTLSKWPFFTSLHCNPIYWAGRSWYAFTEDSIRFRNSNSDDICVPAKKVHLACLNVIILIAFLGGINGPDNGDHCSNVMASAAQASGKGE